MNSREWLTPGNVFELKVLGGQVVAEGSTHPDTGQVYRIVQDLPLIEFPGMIEPSSAIRDN